MGTPGLCALQLLLLLGAGRARVDAARCTYTFVLPQQKFTGAVCWTSEAVNASEVAALRVRVGQHEALLRELRSQTVQAGEVRAAQKVAARSQQLEGKFRELEQLVSRQSGVIARLERLCPEASDRQQQVSPGVLPPPLSLVSSTSNTSRRLDLAPEPQRDHTLRPQGPLASPLFAGHPAISTKPVGPWRDCTEAHVAGHRQSGVYELQLGRRAVSAWCEQQLEGGGWTVIQRRQDGSVNFFTSWQQYKVGFGRPDGEYWLGLEPVYQLTSRGDHELLVLLEDWGGRKAHAHYDGFSLEPESDHYRLRLGQYHGDAGDSLSWHNDKPFSTVDRDRDSYSGNCALYQRGGWWYHACAHSNLNGVWHHGGHYRSRYQDGVYWAEFRGGAYSLKKVSMLIRPLRP
uniref:Angiopoietin-like 6 n=1 Tax=Jaculus jaculus TaxID=51337 RepID=A0A8C5KYW7_JACJA